MTVPTTRKPAAKKRAAQKTAQKTATKAATKKTVDKRRAQELSQAEERGAGRVRDELRALVHEHRRVVKVRNKQVEVVGLSALDEILEDHEA